MNTLPRRVRALAKREEGRLATVDPSDRTSPVDTLDFVKVTEAGRTWPRRAGWAAASANIADGAAVEKMRDALNDMEIAGRIVIGEGERDEAPMLFIGEELGRGGFAVDIAVDPVEGTNLVANGLPNSIAVMAIAERGGLLHAPDSYMQKLAVGPKAAPYVHIDAPVAENLEAVANALERPINDVTVVILDRPRHAELIADVRAAGARIKLISDGDVDAAIATAVEGTGHPRRDGDRRRARGRAGGGGAQVPGRRLHGAAQAAQPRGGRARQGDGFRRPGPRADDRRPVQAARTSSSSRPGSPTATWCAASASWATKPARTRS